jgi:hypothetical protein
MEVVESKDLGKYEEWTVGANGNASERHIDPIILKKTIRDEE